MSERTEASRARRLVTLLAPAGIVGTTGASLVHGEFESMMKLIWIGLASTFVLLTIGSILRPWRPTKHAGSFIVRCGIVAFLAIPVAFLAARGVVRIDTWRAKRYVLAQLGPLLERTRSVTGQYPSALRLWEAPPANAPWLIRRFNYSSDGHSYTLSVMDPGVCGRITSYSSATRRWSETYDPCWY